ncbi:hypothetical protein CKK33_07035 [Mucilaginibacter sp. MD40]|uniref:DUF3810 domain-containing protein n=1 Tax=Mucilaginibacter sp. MD40 TaxID=2029590 RepID=UPI000BACC32B|nr:DUF3810 domain-containing protein [Mucilaginibacter sp. MD40]PAW93265.1 hypothetical protein CKK33_07035 [Mucilaginibacter sp. MD40]
MARQFTKQAYVKAGITVLVLFIVNYMVLFFADYPHAVERYYAKGLYPVVCHILHPVFNLVAFSVGDVLYIAVIVYLLFIIIRLVKQLFKKQFAAAGLLVLKIIAGVEVGMLVFYLFWGLNYFRPSAAERLHLADSSYSVTELKQVTAVLIDSANATRGRVTAADMRQSNDTIYHTARKAVIALANRSPEFKTYQPDIKPSLLTPLLNYIGTSGYYNPFTGEAQMNYQMPLCNRPFVACHEMAHQMGYGPEDEANFVGFLAARSAADRLLRYSAYNLAVSEFLRTVRYTDTIAFKELKKRLSPRVIADLKAERAYWLSYQTQLNAISSVFYDNFLKANNQPQGLETYNRMVLLVMAMYKKEGV